MSVKSDRADERVAVRRDAGVHKETVEACIEAVREIPHESAIQLALWERVIETLESLRK